MWQCEAKVSSTLSKYYLQLINTKPVFSIYKTSELLVFREKREKHTKKVRRMSQVTYA